MKEPGALPSSLLPFRKARLPAMLAGVVFVSGVLLSVHTGQLEQLQQISEARTETQTELSDFRARLETEIFSSLALVRGLATDLVLREGMSPEQFATIAAELKRNDPLIRSIALAPGFVISDVYPRAGNESDIGLNLLQTPGQTEAVLRTIVLDDMVLAGPYRTPQGEVALAGRIPVWLEVDGVPKFWGIANVTLDYPALMEEAGLRRLQRSLLIDIRGRDATGPAGERFFGQAAPANKDVLKVPVFVPGGSWLITVYPRDGWYATPWWRTRNGAFGLLISLLAALASYRILYDRQHIRLLAGIDPLTRLPNRRQALRHLDRLLDRGRRNDSHFAVLSIDLDGFKPVNDRLGHAAGDRLLERIGARLAESVRVGDLVARMGGDEFLVILREEEALPEPALLELARRIQLAIAQPVNVVGESVAVGASIGIASFPQHGGDASALLQSADEAMYRAKRERRGGLAIAGAQFPARL
jgi:diguanylate cyclase (GGDEF)-like protein